MASRLLLSSRQWAVAGMRRSLASVAAATSSASSNTAPLMDWYLHENNRSEEWSHSISFASPESDFVATKEAETYEVPSRATVDHNNYEAMHSSPETALGMVHRGEFMPRQVETSQQNVQQQSAVDPYDVAMTLSSPETAIGVVHMGEFQASSDDASTHNTTHLDSAILTLLLTSSPESAIGATHIRETARPQDLVALNAAFEKQKQAQQRAATILPHSLQEALQDERPIVVTTAQHPFQVVDVNEAWVGLCGYSRQDALDRPIADLLQGPDTNVQTARAMMEELEQREFAYSESKLVNYSKEGRRFENHVQVGKLETDEEVLLVGVLQEVLGDEGANLQSQQS